MELTKGFDDEKVRLLLIGDETALADAIALADATLQRRFIKGARERLPGLRSEDLADAWNEALLDVVTAVRKKTFDPNPEFAPWFWTIFYRRAVDKLRRRDSYSDLLDRAKRRLHGTAVGDLLARMDEEERLFLLDRIRKAIEILPPRQRTVIEVFMAHYPSTEEMQVLRVRVSEVTHREESLAAVKRALQEARRKMGEVLKNPQ
jgi:RNA polymerase sigma factor (sigma-70 family)